jgi:hypothetical protein
VALQQSPVLLAVDDDGRFVISSHETEFKTKNLRRDRAHLCVFQDGFFGDWDEYRESLRLEHRVILRVEATRAGPGRKG